MPQAIRNLARLARGPRRGSVLILVVALLVLIALMGTAFLTSTQNERYTSVQNGQNTAADLQLQGVMAAIDASAGEGLYGTTGNGVTYRPPSQQFPTYDGTNKYASDGTPLLPIQVGAGKPAYPALTGYAYSDDPTNDAFLSARVPMADAISTPAQVTYGPVGFPVFPNSAQAYPSGQPFFPQGVSSAALVPPTLSLPAAYKGYIQFYPTFTTVNGQTVPAAVLYLAKVPPAYAMNTLGYPRTADCPCCLKVTGGFDSGASPSTVIGSQNLIPNPYAADVFPAADTDGDGIADAVFFPVSNANGISYYAAYRMVDGNSAVNVSTAWTSDLERDATTGATADGGGAALHNYGFNRADIGLLQLLNPTNYDPTTYKLATINNARFGGSGTYPVKPANDDGTAADFSYATIGDAMEQQLVGRPGRPGYESPGGGRFQWIGPAATGTFAHRSAVQDTSSAPTVLEQALADDVLHTFNLPTPPTLNANVLAAPLAAGGTSVATWFSSQFAFAPSTVMPSQNFLAPSTAGVPSSPLRSILTGSGAVSNATPSRLANVTSTPPAWTVGNAGPPAVSSVYKFGDWVTENGRSYVCICPHTASAATEPGTGVNPAATPFWAGTLAVAPTAAQVAANTGNPGVPFTRHPVKTSVNTAPFEQLYLAFAQVMCDSVGPNAAIAGGATPTDAATVKLWQPPMQPAAVVAVPVTNPYPEQQLPMFRSVIRDPSNGYERRLTSSQMLQLRAAIAAVNTIDLRDSDDEVTSRRVTLTDTSGNPAYEAEVYGTEAQPFIGAVYAHVETATPASDFIAIQLVNPYDHAITMTPSNGWRLGTVNRSTLTTSPTTPTPMALTMTDVSTSVGFTAAVTVPAKSTTTGKPGVAVLEFGTRPAGYSPPTTVTPVTLTNAASLLTGTTAGELYFMRPRLLAGYSKRDSGTAVTGASVPVGKFGEQYDEKTNVADLVPVDQVDLTSLSALAAKTTGELAGVGDFYYRRGSDPTATTGLAGWNFVYPGPYVVPNGTTAPAGFGSNYMTAPTAANPVMDQAYGYNGATGPDKTGTASPLIPTYQTYPIVLNNTYMAGPNRLATARGTLPTPAPAAAQFPFGGFAREVDMLQIPYIGAYRLRQVDAAGAPVLVGQFAEMNSVSMDSSLANDTSTTMTDVYRPSPADTVTTQFTEQIGRFCPIGTPDPAPNPTLASASLGTLDFGSDPTMWHYRWANRLFDYLSVHAPSDDYFPNVDPTPADVGITVQTPVAKYDPLTAPVGVANTSSVVINNQTGSTSEDTTGVEGLVNINTAPWPVIAALPLVPAGTDRINYTPMGSGAAASASIGANQVDDRVDLAKAIVDDRTVNGPFRSITDLNRVQAFRLENDALITTPLSGAPELGPADGLFSPFGIGGAAETLAKAGKSGRPRFDFEERFMLLNRISNLITTRSDTFTCYVLVQGYRDVGVQGVTPTMVVQRRAAYLFDRNGVTPASRTGNRYPVPVN